MAEHSITASTLPPVASPLQYLYLDAQDAPLSLRIRQVFFGSTLCSSHPIFQHLPPTA